MTWFSKTTRRSHTSFPSRRLPDFLDRDNARITPEAESILAKCLKVPPVGGLLARMVGGRFIFDFRKQNNVLDYSS
jgi:hypothetical protein